MDKKILAIINPAAAGGKTAKIWPKKNKYVKKEFINFDEVYTKKSGEAVKFAQKAVEENYDYIMSVGGDGTVNEIINGMLLAEKKEIRTKLIIYPLGTGSDLSRTLNLPTNIDDFIELVKREKSKSIKVVAAEFFNYQQQKRKRYFINIADCGMGAVVAKKLNKSRKKLDGSLSYLVKIFQTLFNYRNKEIKVEADDKLLYQGKIKSVIIAHGNYFGGGIKIAPEADLFSDKLNLVLLKDFSKLGIILNLIKAYKGKHLSHSLVESYQVEKIKITTQERVELELDGESLGLCDASFEISRKEIEILV
ncbi:YegS/Rv2252/BmrU family lipid kinase [Halanaerobium saccharolyticum]|uniref:YegS/Rv2252/BmrU family lipid kinase n=1 Tax=Halanaerobium saccharolyticum TaxID=43595 RepID=A0A4V3G5V4_9FIRM|nr:diacylglycerol kinase family protein [Halanaerobium saccharolyticum]RAK04212.1 YegS/Rv2252/BmrU family lipid kinase [Halanaerobium saccharolyticum]TDW06765.1 YegS/Rv2252/BmrU family lipid kinase [Halanaerobium saccharolyticum]TDX62400.1 YegS/Rv2252/BmrU family lipid kinase [Halanaerobium saccharolyticum]